MINKTHAKEIVLYFLEAKGWKATPAVMGKHMAQAKKLLECGFTKEEIIKGIDYFTKICPPKGGMYSLGLLNVGLNDALDKMKENEYKEIKKREHTINVSPGGDSSENNRRKLERFNRESRIRTSDFSDLFKKS
jgi:hypothetical protein